MPSTKQRCMPTGATLPQTFEAIVRATVESAYVMPLHICRRIGAPRANHSNGPIGYLLRLRNAATANSGALIHIAQFDVASCAAKTPPLSVSPDCSIRRLRIRATNLRPAAFCRCAIGARITAQQTHAAVSRPILGDGIRQSFVRHGSAACRRRRSSAACKGNT